MKDVNGSGEYVVKATGEHVQYTFVYPAYTDINEAVEKLGADVVLRLAQRMVKLDASNGARERAKALNGHTTRVRMSETDKAEAKAERAENKALLARVMALSPEQRAALGL